MGESPRIEGRGELIIAKRSLVRVGFLHQHHQGVSLRGVQRRHYVAGPPGSVLARKCRNIALSGCHGVDLFETAKRPTDKIVAVVYLLFFLYMTSLLAGAKSDTHVGLRDLRHTFWHAQTYSRATALAAKRVKAHFFAFGML